MATDAQNCPYCGITFSLKGVSVDNSFPKFERFHPYATGNHTETLPESCKKKYTITSHRCPQCHQQIMWLTEIIGDRSDESSEGPTILLFPKTRTKVVPPEVPPKYAADFRAAHDILDISPKASAALSRRCLQLLIHDQEKISEKTLFAEVEKLINLNRLPPALSDELHAIREIGNFAAHPFKDTNTGEIVDVEPGEAQWIFDVVEKLLDFYFVEAARTKARREALNQKLVHAGKNPIMKT